jgi:hypothetical protein
LPLLSPPRRVESIVNLQLLVYTKPCSTLFSSGDVMAFATRFVVPIAFSALVTLAGCGDSSGPVKPTPPPTGGFSVADLKGTYVFSIVGSDASNNFLAMTGVFTATGTAGNGGITDGTIDINDSGLSTPITNNPITGGSYTVTADGRGQATLITATPFGSSITVDFVLTSSARGFISEFDGNASGSGSLELQTAVTQPAAGTYVLGLSGIGTNVSNLVPAAAAGVITLDSSGAAIGSYDYNNNGTPALITINAGSALSAGSTPGTATLVTSGGTLNFDVYSIDATHMKLIEKDSFPILTGDLFAQTSSAFPSGSLVFTMAGFDFSTANSGPLTVGGLMTSDGTSTISSGEEDYNDAGITDSTPLAFSGTIAPSSGRYVLTISGFENGAGGTVGTFSFAAYPSLGGIELVEIDGAGVTSGVAFSQSNTAVAASQGYGMNVTGSNANGFAEDDIAEFVTTNTGLSGIIDINDQGQTSFAQKLRGSYSADSPATGRGIMNTSHFNGAYYTVDASTVLFLEADSTQVGLGAFQTQNASASSNLASSHLAMLRIMPAAKAAWRKH